MKDYLFKEAEFGLNSEGFHLLRNHFNYQTIPFQHVVRARLFKGKIHKNWILMLIIGSLLLIGSFVYVLGIIGIFYNESNGRIYIEQLVAFILPLFTSFYFFYLGLHQALVLEIEYEKKRKRFHLKKLERKEKSEIQQLLVFLNNHVEEGKVFFEEV